MHRLGLQSVKHTQHVAFISGCLPVLVSVFRAALVSIQLQTSLHRSGGLTGITLTGLGPERHLLQAAGRMHRPRGFFNNHPADACIHPASPRGTWRQRQVAASLCSR